jgi:hypothetical protein
LLSSADYGRNYKHGATSGPNYFVCDTSNNPSFQATGSVRAHDNDGVLDFGCRIDDLL